MDTKSMRRRGDDEDADSEGEDKEGEIYIKNEEGTLKTRTSLNARTKIFSLILQLNPPQPQLQASKKCE